jgi:hypothetical protein
VNRSRSALDRTHKQKVTCSPSSARTAARAVRPSPPIGQAPRQRVAAGLPGAVGEDERAPARSGGHQPRHDARGRLPRAVDHRHAIRPPRAVVDQRRDDPA